MLKKLLLITFALLVILAIGFVVFNPLERMRESRDTQRINDLTSLKKAIDTYISNNAKDIAANPALLCSSCSSGKEVFSYRKIKVSATFPSVSDTSYTTTVEKQKLYVNATGWVPLDLARNARLGQTPLKILPLDPLEKGYSIRTKLPFFSNEEDFVYTFTAGIDNKYKLTAKLESKKGLEKAKSDGGTLENRIEVGTDITLRP
jgi:hypothetical protein